MIATLLFFAVIFGVSWVYATVKTKAKREVFFKEQYDTQRSLTHSDLHITTNATVEAIRHSLDKHIPADESAKAVFFGGSMKKTHQTDFRTVWQHRSKITTGGDGDEFTASVTFRPENNRTHAVVSIDRWREKDGITRRAGIRVMQQFMDAAVAAFKETDPNAHVETRSAA
ncbi:hypothetical protein [Antrihabitans cavernicola]|uniref:Uncharacterized protein n=1 Tax=Antrihabitans cavernicola TaxID=2495913 RepID=A0A5A7S313_9NOCA|nr:hypothetical protein [Spelaeibacter cavernicola]KAA0018533.1 hypothetical protein FOY51_23945 [Spelaeibacter cavernicola]